MDNERKEITVELGVFGIVLTGTEIIKLGDRDSYTGGAITSELLDTCSHCNDPACEMECPNYQEYCSDRDLDCQIEKQQEGIDFRKHRAVGKAIESMVFSHWCAGIDVTTPAYKYGIESAYFYCLN